MSILAAYLENGVVQNIIMAREEDFENENIQRILTKTSSDGKISVSLPVIIGMNWSDVENLQLDDSKIINYEKALAALQHPPEVL